MKLLIMTAVVMTAFAANSLLNRAALSRELIDPLSFSLIRVACGALVLGAIGLVRKGRAGLMAQPDVFAVIGLTLYLLGFSFAYLSLDAGLGALILFGGVQVTMFAAGVLHGEQIPSRRWFGMAVSMLGLLVLFWPSEDTRISAIGAGWMATAALGWGVYSFVGRGVSSPIEATFRNFLFTTPLILLSWIVMAENARVTLPGLGLAGLSGAVASGLGYALWYAVLPMLGASLAALAQLSVPIIAALMGLLFLGEALESRFLVSAALVLGGIAAGVSRQRNSA